jgi:mevalonate pyrophosphate decarboxylase
VNRRYFSINTTGSFAGDVGLISAAAASAAVMSALVAPQMSASDRQGVHDDPRLGS